MALLLGTGAFAQEIRVNGQIILQAEKKAGKNGGRDKIQEKQVVVSGIVKCKDEPVTYVTVKIKGKGKKIHTFTKWNGKYPITAPKNSTLVYSFAGTTEKIKIKGASRIDADLESLYILDDRVHSIKKPKD